MSGVTVTCNVYQKIHGNNSNKRTLQTLDSRIASVAYGTRAA